MKSTSLTHHGILGMHWGVRKPEESGSVQKAKPESRHAFEDQSRKIQDTKMTSIDSVKCKSELSRRILDVGTGALAATAIGVAIRNRGAIGRAAYKFYYGPWGIFGI